MMKTEVEATSQTEGSATTGTNESDAHTRGASPRSKKSAFGFDWRVAFILLAALVSIPVWRATTGQAKSHVSAPSLQRVGVARVTRQELTQELVCQAELRPYQEVDLHAKVAGFLEKITADIGDQVSVGQVIATLEVPELIDDISRAEAAVKRSQEEVSRANASYEEAHVTYLRLMAVDKAKPNLIAQQELDVAQAKDRTTASLLAVAQAQVDVSKAELSKLRTMLKYSQITAPFSGVITKRYADPGSLIQAGTSSSTQTLPLVRLSQNDRLRLDIPVSVSYVSRINVGDPINVRVASCEKVFPGKIARSTRKIETATRTMEVEVDVANNDLRLIPGMYASVILRLDHRDNALVVPIEAVSRQKSCSVFRVTKENSLEECTVTIGLETPHRVEVVSGLSENDLVMVGSRTQVKPGQHVEPKLIEEVQFDE